MVLMGWVYKTLKEKKEDEEILIVFY